MKIFKYLLATLLINCLTIQYIHAQPGIFEYQKDQLYLIIKQNDTKFIGHIITYDEREILIETSDLGRIYIPKHVIKSIEPILEDENHYKFEEIFATRYFITTNGIPIKKGENYILWNYYGPDFQFGVAENFGVGVMTSWLATPIIGTAKYSIPLSEKANIGLGLLAGTGSWTFPDMGLILPFVSLTYGNRVNNITLSTGYGGLFYSEETYNPSAYDNYTKVNRSEGRVLLSVAGMAKINDKFSLVFDTFISPWGPEQTYTDWVDESYWDETNEIWIEKYSQKTITERSPNLALIIPGLRWQMDADRAFQFGFTGVYFDGEFIEAPIPMVQWFRRL